MMAARAISRGRRDAEQWHRDRFFANVYFPAGLLILIALVIGRLGFGALLIPILTVAVPAAALLLGGLAFVVFRQRLRPPEFPLVLSAAHVVMWLCGLVFALSLSDFAGDEHYPSILELALGADLAAWVGMCALILAVLGWSVAMVAAIITGQRQRDEEQDAKDARLLAEAGGEAGEPWPDEDPWPAEDEQRRPDEGLSGSGR